MSNVSAKKVVTRPKVKEGVDEIVLQWFKELNRPVTAQGIVDALGSKVSKPNCQKALDTLVEQNNLLVKEIKKAKYYYLDQSKIADHTASAAIEAPDFAEDRARLLSLHKNLTEINNAVARIASCRTPDQSAALLKQAELELISAERQLDSLKANTGSFASKDDWDAAQVAYTNSRSTWRQRRELCQAIIDSVAGDTSMAELIEAAGLQVSPSIDPSCKRMR